jgi:putative SOS response-associated peptidase YedK
VTRTFTIITTFANETACDLHDRMPMILEPEDWPTWLGEVAGDPAEMLRPASQSSLG